MMAMESFGMQLDRGDGAFAEDSWSIQRCSGEDDWSSNGLRFQGEGSSQCQRVHSRR